MLPPASIFAKNVFAVHGVNAAGQVELRQPRVSRARLGELIASLPPGVIGMEACSGAHHWLRKKHQVAGTGTSRFPAQVLYQDLGLVRLATRPRNRPRAYA